MDPVSGASKSNVYSTRLGKSNQHPEARGEELTESSGIPSIGPLRTTTRIAECNILSNLAMHPGERKLCRFL